MASQVAWSRGHTNQILILGLDWKLRGIQGLVVRSLIDDAEVWEGMRRYRNVDAYAQLLSMSLS